MTLEETISQFALLTGEPAWVTEGRRNSLTLVDDLALPVFERVKYHRWHLFDETLITDETRDEAGYGVLPQLSNDDPLLIQYGTVTTFEQLPYHLIEQGVIFTDLFTAMIEYPELVQRYYMTQAVKPDENKLTAWHHACMNSGVFIYVPKNVHIAEPLQAWLMQDSSVTEAFNKHVLIVADENSSVSYVERLSTIGEHKNSANIIVEVVAEQGAQVKYAAMDQLGRATDAFLSRRGHLKKDARIDWAIGVLNDGNVVADFDTELVGDGSHSQVNVVGISTARQVQGVDTRVTNYGRHSVGHILQHGVILDRSTLTFNGIGHIIRGAKGADAQQETRVLMLSDQARGDANPILLIDEYDVTAGHAASVGQVDAEQLFYMTSRGIARREAERLVIRGFLGAVITAIPVPEVRAALVSEIDRKLATIHDD